MAARELEPRGPKKVWVVLVIPALELEHERIASHEPIVDQAVGVVGIAGLGHAEESLVPGAAGLHVAHGDQGCERTGPRSARLASSTSIGIPSTRHRTRD